MLIIRRSKLYYTASGIITPVGGRPVHRLREDSYHQEIKIVLYSIWYHHTETSEWSKTAKIQFSKYKHKVVIFMCEFFGCGYCVLLTVNILVILDHSLVSV